MVNVQSPGLSRIVVEVRDCRLESLPGSSYGFNVYTHHMPPFLHDESWHLKPPGSIQGTTEQIKLWPPPASQDAEQKGSSISQVRI